MRAPHVSPGEPPPLEFSLEVRALGKVAPLDELFERLADVPDLFALDGAGSGWSVLGLERLPLGPPPESSSELRAHLARFVRRAGAFPPGPFAGGWLGAWSFDRGAAGERRVGHASDPLDTPRVIGGFYLDFLVRDEASGDGWLVLGDVDVLVERASLEERRARWLERLREPSHERAGPSNPRARPLGEPPHALGPLVRHVTRDEYLRRVELARERIAAGDVYQVNLAQRFSRRVLARPDELYTRLRRLHPAAYMVAARWSAESCVSASSAASEEHARHAQAARRAESALRGARPMHGALLSGSPELLLEFTRRADGRGVARTRPIKGTAPRGATPDEDSARAHALLASAKDRAELAMIVDLERNDLGRVARAGGVRVERFPALESYASVHHLVADVVAEIDREHDALDLLDALFPGGSISGAPKIASLAVIAELEREGRGFFTGSAGWIDVRGHATWNILIRTLVWRPETASEDARAANAGEVSFHVGGGVTWSSDPAAEEAETRDKGRALARVLGAEIDAAVAASDLRKSP